MFKRATLWAGGEILAKSSDILGSPIHLRLDSETEALVEAVAKIRNEKKAEVMRRYIREGAKSEIVTESGAVDNLLLMIRKALAETNKPFEDRLAKITAKNAIASAAAMYTNIEVLGQLGQRNISDIHIESRKKAVAFVRRPLEDFDKKNEEDEVVE